MSTGTPENEQVVIDNISVDVARAAPDSNPYLKVHWLNSFINGIGRRIFDFLGDLVATELRLMPDTADEETAPRWGAILNKTINPASQASGNAVAVGVAFASIPLGTILTSGDNEYTSTSDTTLSDQSINVSGIKRSGSIATVTTISDHGLSSSVPITILGAVETEYNVAEAEISVTAANKFTYAVSGSPTTPATGTITAEFTSGTVPVISTGFGDSTNLDLDAPLALQTPLSGVNDTLNVDFGTVGGGSDEESNEDFKIRYLDKFRNPVAHFNESDIIDKAKEINGVTRVFVFGARSLIGTFSVSGITRLGNVATATTGSPHGFESGDITTITGAAEVDYNVVDAVIIVESTTIFHYVVENTPTTPATGTIITTTSVPMGQVRTYFMRDNDEDSSIPTASEVTAVKDNIDLIRPANTATSDNQVFAPTAVPEDFIFTALTPNTSTMRTSITNNLQQFFDESAEVSQNVDEDLYRSAIANTVDTVTGDKVETFDISSPSGDLVIAFGEIATLGAITFP